MYFSNDGSTSDTLSVDLTSAVGVQSWPMAEYYYSSLKWNHTLEDSRIGYTCGTLSEVWLFWNWFLTSNIARKVKFAIFSFPFLPLLQHSFIVLSKKTLYRLSSLLM